jgi:hypothetical protein
MPSTPAPDPPLYYWAITGRMHGDDEDTGLALCTPFADQREAERHFIRFIRHINGYSEDQLDMDNDVDGNDKHNVYINSVFFSSTPICQRL